MGIGEFEVVHASGFLLGPKLAILRYEKKRTVEEPLPELHQLEVCEFCLVGNPFAEGLDSLVSDLLVYRVVKE